MGRIAGRKVSVLLALSLLLGGIVTAAAQTMSYADAVDQLASACRGDLAKYSQQSRTRQRPAAGLPRCAPERGLAELPADPPHGLCLDCPACRRAARHRPDLRRRYRKIVRHIACRCASRGMPAERCADGDKSGLQPGLHRYRLANGKGSAMVRHQIYAVAALILAVAATVAAADTRLEFWPDRHQSGRRQQ